MSYLKNGNRSTKRKGNQAVTTYNYTNNRLTSTTGAEAVTYGYNNNGSVTSTGSPTYVYDKLGRIVKITGIAPTDSFAYDAENKRVYKNEQGVVRNNIYDIYGNLIAEANLGPWAIDYIWANGEPRARVDNPETEGFAPLAPQVEAYWWYHTDHLGTPLVLTDKNKVVVWKISLDPFGETVSESTPLTLDNLRFPGQYFDRGSGLNFNWNRYYQAKIGRYYQVDPEFSQASINPFAYAKNNALLYIDETGKQPTSGPRTGTLIECGNSLQRFALRKANRTNRVDEGIVQDGKRDALRHCYGMCLIYTICGAGAAYVGGYGHEIQNIFEQLRSGTRLGLIQMRYNMDTENNSQGRECGRDAGCSSEAPDPCFECCLDKLYTGTLIHFGSQKRRSR